MGERHFEKKQLALILVLSLIFSSLFNYPVFAAKKDRTAPTQPVSLRATSVSDTAVSLAWNASADNVGVKSYRIYNNSTLIGNTLIATYHVSGLKPSQTYKFHVIAVDAAGNASNPSNTLTITTLASASTPSPTPAPTPTPTPTPAPTPTPTPTPVPTPEPEVPQTKVVGYYAAWSAYSTYTPDKIDAAKLTHINYAFANIGSDLKITMGYPDIDPANFSRLNALKQANPHLKTLIAVGGWSWSGRFSDAALTDASRTVFADSCVDFIVKHGFDGVDIDWEYPVAGGLSTNIKRPEDKVNFTLLLQKLRERLDARGLIDGKKYLLTFAGASGDWYVNNTELGKLHQYVDFGNIMTYDIHGNWDKYTDFNAPLYNNSDYSPQYKWSVDAAVKAWLKSGFPSDKLVMGVPFYGYRYNLVSNTNNGLYQTYSGGSSITYANIAANYLNAPGYTRYFHAGSMVPWLYNGSTFITYEDEQSIGLKAHYIKNNQLGGAMIWELSQDPNRILMNALYSNLK